MKRTSPILLCCLWLLPASSIGQEQSIDLSITADNSIIDVRGERDFNMGRASAIRLKSFQHHLILIAILLCTLIPMSRKDFP